MTRLPALVLAAGLATACSAPVRNAPAPVERAAKEYKPTAGMTTVYVFRDATQWETGMKDNERISLELDGAPLGVTIAKTFLVTVVPPGPHELVSVADNRASLRIDGRPGEILYVYQDAKYVVSKTTKLQLVEASAAHRRMESCNLVPSVPNQPASQPVTPQPAPSGS